MMCCLLLSLPATDSVVTFAMLVVTLETLFLLILFPRPRASVLHVLFPTDPTHKRLYIVLLHFLISVKLPVNDNYNKRISVNIKTSPWKSRLFAFFMLGPGSLIKGQVQKVENYHKIRKVENYHRRTMQQSHSSLHSISVETVC